MQHRELFWGNYRVKIFPITGILEKNFNHQDKSGKIPIMHYVRKSYRNFKKLCPNHVLISHFRPYWLVRHYLWTINPLCKFEEIFWNHQKYTIFDENSCLALPVTLYLVRFGKICLATASRHCSTHQLNTLYQWRDLFSPFLALKTIQK